jgi:hypothetical protein
MDMHPNDTNEVSGVEPSELEAASDVGLEPVAEAESRPSWTRRTFLKAAALGAAAAALINKTGESPQLGPLTAYANDLSTLPCTANDVEIVGTGVVVNAPCPCTGTFTARVEFKVRNNTGTARYCIAIHPVPSGNFNPGDLILEDANGSSTAPGKDQGESFRETTMFADIPNFPCNVQQVCFGQAGVQRGKCDAGTCSTVSWNTSPNAAGCTQADQSPAGGQCRHQQICIQGVVAPTLTQKAAACNGNVEFEAGPAGCTSYIFKVNGTARQTSASRTFILPPALTGTPQVLDTSCRTVTVAVEGCTGQVCGESPEVKIQQCVETSACPSS